MSSVPYSVFDTIPSLRLFERVSWDLLRARAWHAYIVDCITTSNGAKIATHHFHEISVSHDHVSAVSAEIASHYFD